MKDVEYVYVYRDPASPAMDISIERYVFDGELSWARYVVHEKAVMPGQEGVVEQGYDGTATWATFGGRPVASEEYLRLADFLRKTNCYWFTMNFKLLDPGVNHEYLGTRSVDGIDYETVKVTFDPGVGDVSDTYVLYINPETFRVDRFLFTVMDFGMTDPFLMVIEYEEIDGLLVPAKRRHAPATWSGDAKSDDWTEELSIGVRFRNGFSGEMFSGPEFEVRYEQPSDFPERY